MLYSKTSLGELVRWSLYAISLKSAASKSSARGSIQVYIVRSWIVAISEVEFGRAEVCVGPAFVPHQTAGLRLWLAMVVWMTAKGER